MLRSSTRVKKAQRSRTENKYSKLFIDSSRDMIIKPTPRISQTVWLRFCHCQCLSLLNQVCQIFLIFQVFTEENDQKRCIFFNLKLNSIWLQEKMLFLTLNREKKNVCIIINRYLKREIP